jgi:hypothetical protein
MPEFARTHSGVVYVLGPITYREGAGARAVVRRIEAGGIEFRDGGVRLIRS